jgi:hypothetical protein
MPGTLACDDSSGFTSCPPDRNPRPASVKLKRSRSSAGYIFATSQSIFPYSMNSKPCSHRSAFQRTQSGKSATQQWASRSFRSVRTGRISHVHRTLVTLPARWRTTRKRRCSGAATSGRRRRRRRSVAVELVRLEALPWSPRRQTSHSHGLARRRQRHLLVNLQPRPAAPRVSPSAAAWAARTRRPLPKLKTAAPANQSRRQS